MTSQIRPADKADPWLATDWKWDLNFHKVTFTLDDRAKWADGKPLTAEDVAFTFNLLKKHPALNADGIKWGRGQGRGQEGRPHLRRLAVRQPEQDHPAVHRAQAHLGEGREPGDLAQPEPPSAPARTS